MKREFRKILSEEAEKLWANRKEKIRRKKNHLAEKYRPKSKVDTMRDIKIADKLMPLNVQQTDKPLVLEVEIDEDESNFLLLPASIAEIPMLDVEGMKTDIQAIACKVRMESSNNEGGREPQDSQRRDSEIDARSVSDSRSNTLDFREQKVTDMKNCKRVYVPGPCKKKSKLQTLITRLEDIVENPAYGRHQLS